MRPLIIIAIVIVAMYLAKVSYLDAKPAPPPTSAPPKTSSAAKSNANKAGMPVDIYITEEVNKSNTIFGTGTLVPNEEVALQSEVSGRLVQLNLREGAFVKKGQIIAKIDDADLLAQLKKLEYEEALAAQTEARQKKLLDINAISKEEYDISVNKVNTLSADKELLQVQLEKTAVHAPFSGRLGLKNISEGAYLTPNVVIASLIQTNPLKMDFTLPEKYATKIKVGQQVAFTVDGDTRTMTAKVVAIDPKIDEDLRTLRVRASTTNANGQLLPGMFVRVEVPLGAETSIMIPTQAVIPILKGKKVFVMRGGQAEEVEIKTGLRTNDKIQVTEGLAVGDSVITSALMSVKKGSTVRLRNVLAQ
ncbi:MAG: efflux RND transporter periplasmic adaptor subunit [Bacteroidota bacterium]